MDKVKLTWLGHSCFKIEFGGHSAVIDPYKEVPGYPHLSCSAGAVYTSHDHDDHGYTQAVTLIKEEGESPFKITTVNCFHDGEQGALRGKNMITIFEAGGIKAAHFGDIGHLLSDDKIEKLKGLNAAMIPVGGYYTIDGAQAHDLMKAIDPDVTIPMHYRMGKYGFDVISGPEEFLDLISDRKIVKSESDHIEIGASEEKRAVLLTFKGAGK